MTADPETSAVAGADEEKEEFKCYIGRVPTKFTEETVQRILTERLREETTETDTKSSVVEKVELIYPHDEEDNFSNNDSRNKDGYRADRMNSNEVNKNDPEKEHRGFGFVLFATPELRDLAVNLGTIKGGRKKTSKKFHTMYLRPYVAKVYDDDVDGQTTESQDGGEAETNVGRDICYLWNSKRCPYGDECKFRHVGEGGCVKQEKDLSPEERKRLERKRKGKCFVYKKKGSCSKGEDCPFSHNFEPDTKSRNNVGVNDTTNSKNICVLAVKKDCINWKTKGKCRKGDKCVYKHDPTLQKKALDKILKKKRSREEVGDNADNGIQKKRIKEKEPLSVRVFGLNYDTTEADIKEFMESTAGHPTTSIVFPTFEDSNRSKGYCGVYFASPKAARAAVEKCDNAELHGRWLRVQTGKSMTVEAWEGLHHK